MIIAVEHAEAERRGHEHQREGQAATPPIPGDPDTGVHVKKLFSTSVPYGKPGNPS
jgi:hypothetical protein